MSRWLLLPVVAAAFACASSTTLPDKQVTGNDGAAIEAGNDCRGPGRYEAGKEGSYRPCCAGLNEIFLQAAGDVNGVPQCMNPLLRIYACVRGSCGDGVCEEGEAAHCGCVADCPSAAWGSRDAGLDDSSANP